MSFIVIAVCVLLLLAYVFDITASKTKIPSVILLLLLGYASAQGSKLLGIEVPDLSVILPVLGTIGLILIVLEGALELEIRRDKLPLIGKSLLLALLPMLVLSLTMAFVFQYFSGVGFKQSMLNAIPLSVISSAIAIPSVRYQPTANKDFITYESSLSDIFGVLLFNFVSINDQVNVQSVGLFVLDVVLILLISLVSAVVLAFLLRRIQHSVKFVPVILMVILVYYLAKHYHLPALIFILLFGLLLGNIEGLKQWSFFNRFHPEVLKREVHKFLPIISEITFLIRAMFFLVFGFLIQTEELFNPETALWAIWITSAIFILRAIFLLLMRMPLLPLMFIAPRGLITILLFLSIPLSLSMSIMSKSLIIQVIVMSALVMMFGLMIKKR